MGGKKVLQHWYIIVMFLGKLAQHIRRVTQVEVHRGRAQTPAG